MSMKWKSFISNPLKRKMKLCTRNYFQSMLYLVVEDRSCKINKPCHIVMVCKGNVCRSVFAEHNLKRMIGDDNVFIESCGLDVNQGNIVPKDAIYVAQKYDLNLSTHTSKSLSSCDIGKADLILVMEFKQYLQLVTLFPDKKSRIRLLRKFAPFPHSLLCNIDDPYGYGIKEYTKCYSLIDCSLKGLLKKCIIKNGL